MMIRNDPTRLTKQFPEIESDPPKIGDDCFLKAYSIGD